MQILKLKRKSFDASLLKRVFTEESDCENLITGHFVLFDEDTNEIVAINAPLPQIPETDALRHALLQITNWTVASRGSGLKTTAKVFGYQPRSVIRQRPFCHRGVLAREQPRIHDIICAFSLIAQNVFQETNPKAFEQQFKLMQEKVKPEWRMYQSMYTSGIANNNNALGYHRDRGNFENYWSAMAVFRKDIEGGNLIVKDYDIKIKFSDASIFFFNGQQWWHGVTPIKKQTPQSYRFTVVYYALKEMWKCLTLEDELNYAIKTRQAIETKRMRK